MTGPTPRRVQRFVCRQLHVARYLQRPGDGRVQPRIAARALLWAQLIGQLLRAWTFHAIEALVHSPARRALGVACRFGDDALAYFTERLDPAPTRQALAQIVRRATRNKAFEPCRFIGLALDGTGAGRSEQAHCRLCHPLRDGAGTVTGHLHHRSLISVVGAGLTLPLDVEPYGPGDSEYAASQRLLTRTVTHLPVRQTGLGPRFAQYVVADGAYATAPFLQTVGALGLRVVARLKGTLPELSQAAQSWFGPRPPTATLQVGLDWVELWDADHFDPWTTLQWPAVRVLRYRQHTPDGQVVEAYWLTDFPVHQVGPRALYGLAKSRWEIENQGFNDAKTRYGLEHIRHHHENSLLIGWLVVVLAMTIERLYRLRFLHRGAHRVQTAATLLLQLWLSLGSPHAVDDTS